jgi:hypothetical protein
MVIISNPAKKVSYTIYPAMEAYVETELQDAPTPEKVESYKVKTTELGKDTFDGHPTVKNKVVVTDDTNAVYEATLWNATDLKNFPVKIESENEGVKTVMIFKNEKLTKPDASQFEIPSGYKKYGNMMELMQQMVMKQMGGMGAPGAPGRTRPDNQ